MTGAYIIFGSSITAFALVTTLIYREMRKSGEDKVFPAIFATAAGVVAGMFGLVISAGICIVIDTQVDILIENNPDDAAIATILSLEGLENIELVTKDTGPNDYLSCEVFHNGELIAPFARRRKTIETYNRLQSEISQKKENSDKDLYKERVNSILKNYLEQENE